ncbi:MAG: type IV pilus twitching motility protein PilT [bacterium]|jgi:twitching motility protein PilT|nr:type IV pilus twitching motility protein PilT [bacterium]
MEILDLFRVVDEMGASDLLLTAGVPPMIRVDGRLDRTAFPVLDATGVKKLVYSLLNEKQRLDFETRKEIDFSLGVGDKHRFRVNVYYQKGCVAAAFRPIPDRVPRIETLGLPPVVSDLALRPQGLVLVTGPTGHGKSTTLASMIDVINTSKQCHIVSIEDPIEYVHDHKLSVVDQRELGGDTHSFLNALKYVLRQDPDVILVGEMRDYETIAAALTAAETGHLVLATLHTNDAVQTINRIIDVFEERQQQQIRVQLSLTLQAVISQRLLPREDGMGRVLAYEILRNNHACAALIREGKTHQLYSVIETGTKDAMITMDACLVRLYEQGYISAETTAMHLRNPQVLLDSMSKMKQVGRGGGGRDARNAEPTGKTDVVSSRMSKMFGRNK